MKAQGYDVKSVDLLTRMVDHGVSMSFVQELDALGYKPVSSIRDEVGNLRRALESGKFADIDASEHYNMKIMKLARNPNSYAFLSR